MGYVKICIDTIIKDWVRLQCLTWSRHAGDMVSKMISNAGLPNQFRVFLYAINPQVANGTNTLTRGAVTISCFRITDYNRLMAMNGHAQAPSVHASSTSAFSIFLSCYFWVLVQIFYFLEAYYQWWLSSLGICMRETHLNAARRGLAISVLPSFLMIEFAC